MLGPPWAGAYEHGAGWTHPVLPAGVGPGVRPFGTSANGTPLSTLMSGGRLSTRSPMMLRCTWSVPPPIRSPGIPRNPDCHSPFHVAARVPSIPAGPCRVDGELIDVGEQRGSEQLHDRSLGTGHATREIVVIRRRTLNRSDSALA